jgi:hypothetical protein
MDKAAIADHSTLDTAELYFQHPIVLHKVALNDKFTFSGTGKGKLGNASLRISAIKGRNQSSRRYYQI